MVAIPVPDPDFGGGRWGRGRCKSVVVADTERHVVRLIQVNLERRGIDVVAATDVASARQRIVTRNADLLIISLAMEGCADLLRELRGTEATADIRSIGLSDAKGESEASLLEEYRVDAVVRKPFNPADLVRIVTGG